MSAAAPVCRTARDAGEGTRSGGTRRHTGHVRPLGPNDLFICEDSHQTAQNLRWAMGILSAGAFTDMEGEDEAHGYRSARS